MFDKRDSATCLPPERLAPTLGCGGSEISGHGNELETTVCTFIVSCLYSLNNLGLDIAQFLHECVWFLFDNGEALCSILAGKGPVIDVCGSSPSVRGHLK